MSDGLLMPRKALSFVLGAIAFLGVIDNVSAADDAQRFRPYVPNEVAATTPVGSAIHERFPDLKFKRSDGTWTKLSDYHGKIVVLHLWGAWCPPCRKELPGIAALSTRFRGDDHVQFIFFQMWEPFAKSTKYLKQQGLDIPVFDSTMTTRNAPYLLADDTHLTWRELKVKWYPTTIVLDRNGVVIGWYETNNFHWDNWEAGIRDAIENSPTPNPTTQSLNIQSH